MNDGGVYLGSINTFSDEDKDVLNFDLMNVFNEISQDMRASS